MLTYILKRKILISLGVVLYIKGECLKQAYLLQRQ